PAVVATRRRLTAARGSDRAAVAAIAAVALAFAFSLALDWMWQLTVVGAIGVASLALLTGPATDYTEGSSPTRLTRRGRLLARGLSVALAFGVIAALAVPLLAQTDVRSSQVSASKGDRAAALRHALD